MKKMRFGVLLLVLPILLLTVPVVLAQPTGTVRIEPALPVESTSPADFEVWVKPSGDPTSDPHIFLVMTASCYAGLDSVKIYWGAGEDPDIVLTNDGVWTEETVPGTKVPPDTTNGAGYTVASLKDHLGTTDSIYWAFVSILDGDDITQTPTPFTIILNSESPKMLVYILGETSGSSLFDNRVPPTIPGFVIPEPATIAAVVTPLIGLIGYAAHRRRH